MTSFSIRDFARGVAGVKSSSQGQARGRRLPIGIGLLIAAILSGALWTLVAVAIGALLG